MFENNFTQQYLSHSLRSSVNSDRAYALATAEQLYRRKNVAGRLAVKLAKLLRKPDRLQNLEQAMKRNKVTTQHYLGVRSVPIDKIVGSESRCDDFDASFRPLKEFNHERWTNIASLRLLDYNFQAVELIQVGDEYFVRDGHHRVSVARALGQQHIDAEVVCWTMECPIPDKISVMSPAVSTVA